MLYKIAGLMALVLAFAACQSAPVETPGMIVSLVADGFERTFIVNEPMTIEGFLQSQDIERDENDRLNPPAFTQISDGIRITIVRVDEETACEREAIPYEEQRIFSEALAPGEERISQVGQNGEQELCYRVILEDGVERDRIPISQPQVITAPINEIRTVGIDQDVEPIPIIGTLAYLSNGNAWVMDGTSTSKRVITNTSDLDSHVMALSPDGDYLIYTREPEDAETFVNELWLIESSGNREPLKLEPTDVLYAEWLPTDDYTISFSTSEVQELAPYWDALNNLWTMRINPETGQSLNIRQIVRESTGGASGWWGTVFKWSPDGEQIAWARADSAGIVDEEGNLISLLNYPYFRVIQNWSWRASLSWSWDSNLLLTVSHGAPLGSQPADRSPVFDVTVTDLNDELEATIIGAAGIWSSPTFSPPVISDSNQFESGYMAYLQARDPFNSVNGEYDLVVADRDGSNSRIIFPPQGRSGIRSENAGQILVPRDYVWSPDGRQIAVTYQGNLWVVDVESTVAHQLTFDGGASYPIWSR